MAKIYGAFTPGQTLCQHFPNIISFNPHDKIQEIETIFYPPFINKEIEAQRGEAVDTGSHSSWMVDFRDLVGSSQRLSSSPLCVFVKVLPYLHLKTFQDKGSMNGFIEVKLLAQGHTAKGDCRSCLWTCISGPSERRLAFWADSSLPCSCPPEWTKPSSKNSCFLASNNLGMYSVYQSCFNKPQILRLSEKALQVCSQGWGVDQTANIRVEIGKQRMFWFCLKFKERKKKKKRPNY